jgi:hypothetical protein
MEITIEDLKKAFTAGADKRNWTKVKLTGVVSGQDYTLEPIFENWFKKEYDIKCIQSSGRGKRKKTIIEEVKNYIIPGDFFDPNHVDV